MEKVEITKEFHNIVTMQVCAAKDATDEEILETCNRKNTSGTTNGWNTVIHEPDGGLFQQKNTAPMQCAKYKERTHFLVLC